MGVISQQLNEEINRVQEDNYVRIELAPQPSASSATCQIMHVSHAILPSEDSAILSNTYNVIVGPGEEPPVPTLRERTLLLPGSTGKVSLLSVDFYINRIVESFFTSVSYRRCARITFNPSHLWQTSDGQICAAVPPCVHVVERGCCSG
jgi:hypothetical protein